ncbi:MAG TPA: hypothetical protein VEH77_09360, partial [Roseiarcus sp.]|nr:hypothetical protein [Roseiarcus sp.]
FAIPPGALRKAPFYVTVALNGVTEGACAVGRTGTVAFASGDEAAAASSRGPDAALFASLRAGFF